MYEDDWLGNRPEQLITAVRKDAMESVKSETTQSFDQVEEHRGTYFYDTQGSRLGSELGVVPLSLYKGMRITISDHDFVYRVTEWNYHLGYKFEEAGLRIIVEATTEPVSGS